MPHPRGGDRQRATHLRRGIQTEVKLALPGREPLTGGRLEQLQLDIVVGPGLLTWRGLIMSGRAVF